MFWLIPEQKILVKDLIPVSPSHFWMQCVRFYHQGGQKSKLSPRAHKMYTHQLWQPIEGFPMLQAADREGGILLECGVWWRTFWSGHWRLPRRLTHFRWYWLLPQWQTRSEGNRRREQHANTRRATNHSHCKQAQQLIMVSKKPTSKNQSAHPHRSFDALPGYEMHLDDSLNLLTSPKLEKHLPTSVQDWSLECPSNAIWPFKIYLSQNNPS